VFQTAWTKLLIFGLKTEEINWGLEEIVYEGLRGLYCLPDIIVSNPCTGLDRPTGFQEVETPRIFRQWANEGGKVVSPMHRPRLPPPPRKYSWYSFLLEAESTPGP
jgi:hypothetical protein